MNNMVDMIGRDRIQRGLYWKKGWGLIEGCTPVSEGCEHCWAARATAMRACQKNPKIRARYEGLTEGKPPRFTGAVRIQPDSLSIPLHVKKPTTFAVWNDLFHEDVPFDFIDNVFAIIDRCPQHVFIILTKRPKRMAEFFDTARRPPLNAWLGVTVENQKRADERIPILLQIPAAVWFVSVEPMLGPVDIEPFLSMPCCAGCGRVVKTGVNSCTWVHRDGDARCRRVVHSDGVDWVVCGGETGPGARPLHPDWARSLRDQCQDAGVPFFFKHWGEWALRDGTNGDISFDRCRIYAGTPDVESSFVTVVPVGKKRAGRLLDGREWNEMPEVKS